MRCVVGSVGGRIHAGRRLTRHASGQVSRNPLQPHLREHGLHPVTVTADAARSFALYGTPASLGAAAAWIGGLLAVFIPLSVWRYRRMS
jgi:hypothetical protein